MKPPCIDCPRREVGCHGKCEEYAAFRRAQDNVLVKRAEDGDQRDILYNSVNRARKNKRKR